MAFGGATITHGQWTVTNLHPAGAIDSWAMDVHNGQQVGSVYTSNFSFRASLWSGTAESWVSLHPAGATQSSASSVHNGQQVGNATFGGVDRASLRSGTAQSWVNLHPVGATESWAVGVHNGQQVGIVYTGSFMHASLWSGTAESRVNLHPAGATDSEAYDVHNGQQVGSVWYTGGGSIASLWSGTAESWVNLHPAGAWASYAFGVDNGQQVGIVGVGESYRASLWSGTAESWVNLHPSGATQSSASSVHNGQQVGNARFGGVDRASLWSGTAESWEDLSLALAGSWNHTYAYGIWSDATTTFVVGTGWNNATGREEALVWTRPNATPGGDFNGDGLWDCADVDGLVAEIVSGSHDPLYDLTGDAQVTSADLDQWLTVAGGINLPSGNAYLVGDANLDGGVDGSDFNVWNASKFTAIAAWCSGDFNADGVVDGSDFNLWNTNKFQSADNALAIATNTAAVPEPTVMCLLVLGSVAFLRRFRIH